MQNIKSDTTSKNIGIELLRIVSMFMIVVLHCFNVGGILGNVAKFSVNYFVSNFIFLSVFVAVNLYALTTGYLCVFSRHKYSRIVNLWVEVLFYSVVLTLMFFILPNYSVNKSDMVFSFFPLITDRYWYFTAYFLLFLFMPFINKALTNITKRYFQLLLCFLFILCSVCTFIGSAFGYYSLDVYFLNNGLSFLWLFIMYIFGAYIRIHGIAYKKNNYKYLATYLIFTLMSLLALSIKNFLSGKFNVFKYFEILSYSFPFILLASISLFCFFKNLNITKVNKAISKIASVTFSVYLISAHPLVVMLVQKDIFANIANENILVLLLNVAVFSIAEFSICIIIGLLVKCLFNILKVNVFCEKIVCGLRILFDKLIKFLKLV